MTLDFCHRVVSSSTILIFCQVAAVLFSYCFFCQAQPRTAAFLEMSYANRMLQHVDGNNSETVECCNKDEGKGRVQKNRLQALQSA